MTVRPAKTQISLGIRLVRSEFSLCAKWVAKDPSFPHADSEDCDQTGRMPRLIWVFAGRTVTLLVLSCRGSSTLIMNRLSKSKSDIFIQVCTCIYIDVFVILFDFLTFKGSLFQNFFFSAQPSIISLLFHISQDFIGQITRMSKFSQ